MRPELLAPAGNMECLEAALRFGADAVYLGMQRLSLRNYADNFDAQTLKTACTLAHSLGKKVYVTVNAFAHDADMDALPALFADIGAAGADALIVNDPGVIRMAKRCQPAMPLHLSTQANTLNSEACLFWHAQGVQRIILARELALSEITAMRKRLPETLELEMFVHGAMCISYSGRCLLSNYIAGRDSDRGECAQPCRWSYELREAGSDGPHFSIEQDTGGSYILNARDLNLIAHIPEILNAGVVSLKVEGRMKSLAYVATVVNAYRMALDLALDGKPLPESIARELAGVSHRPYFTGFALGDPGIAGQYTQSSQYVTEYDIMAVVESYDQEKGVAHIVQRNRFFDGDRLSILSPGDIGHSFCVAGIWNEAGKAVESAPHPKERLTIGCEEDLRPGDILRARRKAPEEAVEK